MATDVAVKATTEDVDAGSVMMTCNMYGSGVKLDRDSEVGAPLTDDGWYSKYNARFDNPDYYTA